ncbi:MAG: PhzF family phenazine biosynthesis protein [Actinomycetota bacterium]|nr:PhzF family phenazine biosynthesis protein [Actinomycetota bacterium]
MDFLQLDVFAEGAFRGNPLAVFPEASSLSTKQMQSVATEMNLSETAFVTDVASDSYSVRIFTPQEELPFAGHPTLGTAWALRKLGKIDADEVQQLSRAGPTTVSFRGDEVWFRRRGDAHDDLRRRDPEAGRKIAKALGVVPAEIGLEPRELGRSLDRLHPAEADVGIRQLLVPLRDQAALARCRPAPHLVDAVGEAEGAYCFTATGAGVVRARGFFPGLGIAEDPATGSAAACLGLYLSARLGPIDVVVHQGVEMGRPSRLLVKAASDHVEVGGHCVLILEGSLVTLP